MDNKAHHKPRLSEAPNGIVGTKATTNRELLSATTVPLSKTSNSTATTIPVGKGASGSPRNRSNTEQLKPQRTLAPPPRTGVQQIQSSGGSPLTVKRDPWSKTKSPEEVDVYSPAGKSSPYGTSLTPVSPRRRANSDSVDKIQQLDPTKPRTKIEEPKKGFFTVGRRGKSSKSHAQTVFEDPGTFGRKTHAKKPSVSVDGEMPESDKPGGMKKRGSSIFGRDKGKEKSPLSSSEREMSTVAIPSSDLATPIPVPPPAEPLHKEENAGAKVGKGGSKKSGFFSKLFRAKTTTDGKPLSAKEAAALKKRKGALAAQELEAREAQLAAAGFSQLPGTLLSRAKGESVDSKFVLDWDQIELTREIGEGAYAMVYLAKVKGKDGTEKDVAMKELKLLGNEEDTDMRLEVAAVADAVKDCGFPAVAETIRVGGELIRDRKTYYSAKQFLNDTLVDFKNYSDPDDDACNFIISVIEGLVALPYPPSNATRARTGTGKGAPQRLLEDVMREVEVLSKLWHKNIVEFVGCCVELPHLAIAMQFCHKGPLSELLISDEVCIGWELRMKWAKETSEAINYLHGIDPKIIHRDLKADNILIDNNDTAYVTDFGLSKAKVLTMMNPAGPVNMAGRSRGSALGISNSRAKYRSFVEFSEIAGTPSYLAPELWRNESYTETVDVYSFGIVLWEILARDVPYRSLDNEELVYALRDRHLRPPIPKWTPESYRLLMERCWAEQPSARPSMEQIMKLLALLLDKHVYQWPPPENYSLNEDIQQQYMIDWEKGKQDKEAAMSLAEKKLLAAKEQLKTLKGTDGQASPRGEQQAHQQRFTYVSPRNELTFK